MCHHIRCQSWPRLYTPRMFLGMGQYSDEAYKAYAEDRRTRNLYEKLARKTRTRNLHLLMPVACAHPRYPISVRKLSHVIASFSHQIEHVLFDARNSHEKNLDASRYNTRTSFSRKLTRTSFSYKFLVRLSSALHCAAITAISELVLKSGRIC